ncbi:MAG TPA: DUF1109 domain-containing protein [Steroidobacteraceae bacterium]|jgi:hypothetical protein
MNTENFIQTLVADGLQPVIPIGRKLLKALGAASVLAMLSLLIRHPRPDLIHAFSTAPFIFKLVLLLSVSAAATVLLVNTARPVAVGRVHWPLLMSLLLLAAGVMVELATVPAQDWRAHLLGHNPVHCLMCILLFSLAPLGCLLLALRYGAPNRPALAGAAAGLTAGAVAATVYALTCPEDSPLFIATWYSAAIAVIVLASAGAGRRFLRW